MISNCHWPGEHSSILGRLDEEHSGSLGKSIHFTDVLFSPPEGKIKAKKSVFAEMLRVVQRGVVRGGGGGRGRVGGCQTNTVFFSNCFLNDLSSISAVVLVFRQIFAE